MSEITPQITERIHLMLEEAKKLHLWKGSVGEKLEKFKIIHKEMNRITNRGVRLRISIDAFESAGRA